jgi:hypothetical protein
MMANPADKGPLLGVAISLVDAYYADDLKAAADRALSSYTAHDAIVACWLLSINVVLLTPDYLTGSFAHPYVGTRFTETILGLRLPDPGATSWMNRRRFARRNKAFFEFGTSIRDQVQAHEQGGLPVTEMNVSLNIGKGIEAEMFLIGAVEFTAALISLESRINKVETSEALDAYRQVLAAELHQAGLL